MRIDLRQLYEMYIFSIGCSYQGGDLLSGKSIKDISGEAMRIFLNPLEDLA